MISRSTPVQNPQAARHRRLFGNYCRWRPNIPSWAQSELALEEVIVTATPC